MRDKETSKEIATRVTNTIDEIKMFKLLPSEEPDKFNEAVRFVCKKNRANEDHIRVVMGLKRVKFFNYE
jgi:hypothetical protein